MSCHQSSTHGQKKVDHGQESQHSQSKGVVQIVAVRKNLHIKLLKIHLFFLPYLIYSSKKKNMECAFKLDTKALTQTFGF